MQEVTNQLFSNKEVINVAYRFKFLPYLIADKNGNFYIEEHFNRSRITPFKKLRKDKGYVNYKGIPIQLSTLRKRAYISNEKINI